MQMQWFYLVLAGGFEVVWATFMKLSHGFTSLGLCFGDFGRDGSQLWVLWPLAVKHLPLSSGLPGLDRDRRRGIDYCRGGLV